MKLLITTGNWSAPLVIMESLAKQGHDVYLLDHDAYCAGFHSRYCKGGTICPEESTDVAYVNSVIDIVQSRKFDLLIPTSDLATEFLSAARERILPFVPMFLPSKELIELARHKKKTYRFALEKNIAIPRTFFPQSLKDVRDIAQSVGFPCIAKKCRGTANKGNTYFDNKESLIRYYEGLKPEDEWPVIQEFIVGNFYGFLGLASQGEIVDCFMYKAANDASSGGTAPYYCSVTDENFLNTIRSIVKGFNWTGAINLDFIQDRQGRFLLLEINPRLSGSLAFAYKLGVDLPSIYLALARGQATPMFERPHYKPGVIFRYVLSSEIIEIIRNKRHALKFIGSCFDFRMKTDIPWRDPILLLHRLKHLWWHWRDIAKGRQH